MLVEFTKMNGAGNDFVMIDNRDGTHDLSPEQVIKLCNRRKGVGADGVILLEQCKNGNADYAWSFYNSDGSTAEMCGNGARCFARFIQQITDSSKPLSFETISGIIHTKFLGDQVQVGLTPPHSLQAGIKLSWDDQAGEVHFINTGVPHAVYFVKDIESVPVQKWGAALRFHPHFAPKGTNVNFAQVQGDKVLVRTYERGVEGETWACGTGVTATALITSRVFGMKSPIHIQTRDGDILEVGFEWDGTNFKNVTLTGPAETSFTGQTEI